MTIGSKAHLESARVVRTKRVGAMIVLREEEFTVAPKALGEEI